MKNKKILILYALFGKGHKMAAEAVEEVFKEKYPNFEVKNIDILDFGFKIFRKSSSSIFDYITFRIPFLYKWIYNFYNDPFYCKFLKYVSGFLIRKKKFVNFIKEFNPDFILSTNPLPTQLLSETKEKNIINILSGNVCTDFGFHYFWHNLDINYYFVASENIKKSLILHNILPEKIKMTGIPISLKFSKKTNREEILKNLNFNPAYPVLLIVGAKITYKNLLKVINGVKERNKFVQFIIVAGRDENLQKKLKKSKIKKDPFVKVFGFVNNLDEYMGVADLIFTKAGGLTVSECLAKGLPMIINEIMPGQEEDNVNYLVSNGAGIKVKNIKEVIKNITDLFSSSAKLEEIKKNCLKISKPNASIELVEFINNILYH